MRPIQLLEKVHLLSLNRSTTMGIPEVPNHLIGGALFLINKCPAVLRRKETGSPEFPSQWKTQHHKRRQLFVLRSQAV